MRSGRIRKPPRSAYIEFRTKIGRLVFKASSLGFLWRGGASANRGRELIKSAGEVAPGGRFWGAYPGGAYALFMNQDKVNDRLLMPFGFNVLAL